MDSPSSFIEVFTSKLAAWEGMNESPLGSLHGRPCSCPQTAALGGHFHRPCTTRSPRTAPGRSPLWGHWPGPYQPVLIRTDPYRPVLIHTDPLLPCTASGCQQGRRPGLPAPHHVPQCPVLPAMPHVARCSSLCLPEEPSSQRAVPKRHVCLGSFLSFPHQGSRTRLPQDPQLHSPRWQRPPRSPDRQKVPRGGPTPTWSHDVLLLGGQHLMQLISTATTSSLPASRLPTASGAARF